MIQVLNKNTAFSESERQELLDRCFPVIRRREELLEIAEAADSASRKALQPEIDNLGNAIRNDWDMYINGVPEVAMSRCPFTKQVFCHSIDSYGIDGFWWSRHKPLRPMKERLGGNFFSFSGSVAAPEQAPDMPFLAVPGGEAPYVIERLMMFDSIVAVISHLKIGGLDAYPMVYFSAEPIAADQRSNDWAIQNFSFYDDDGHFRQLEYFDAEDKYLYDLKPWVASKRLLWIAPDDESLTLRSGLEHCPYLDLPGEHKVWRAKSGRVWHGPVGVS